MSAPSRGVVAASVVVALVGGCRSQERPTADAWLPQWRSTVEIVEGAAGDGVTPDRATCQDVLVTLRERNTSLEHTPSEALDRPVEGWLATAESAFFDCHEPTAGADPFGEAMTALGEFEAEVEAAIAIETSDG